MEKNNIVSYIVYEAAMTRGERRARRLTVALIVALVIFAGSNIAWMLMIH